MALSGFSFRGIAGGNAFLTDGNDTTDQYFNKNAGRTRITTQLSQDAVQGFQVLSDGYSAEFGRALGGVINTVTRSGGNPMHGTAYWFFRNQGFNARDPFAASNPPETRHQAGASLGGKIVKDKLFYFLNTELVRRDFPLSASLLNPPFFDSNGRFVEVQADNQPTCGAPATAGSAAPPFVSSTGTFKRWSEPRTLSWVSRDWIGVPASVTPSAPA